MSSSFQINEHALDKEWVEQPELFYNYAKKLADARKNYEQKKAEKEVVIAELSRKIRINPEKYGMEKITEKGIENSVTLQPEYINVTHEVIEAKHKVDVYQAGVDALEHKKKALESLVYLHGQNYFSSPREKSLSSKDALEDMKIKNKKKRHE